MNLPGISLGASLNVPSPTGGLQIGASIVGGVLGALGLGGSDPDPVLGYKFGVIIGAAPVAAFTECVLPNLEIDTQEVKEGGQSGYTLTLPGNLKAGRLTLKNGLMVGSDMLNWYLQMLYGAFTEASYKNITVVVYKGGKIVYNFHFYNAFPVKWQGPQLRAEDHAVAVETIEFIYQDVTFDSIGGGVGGALGGLGAAIGGALGGAAGAAIGGAVGNALGGI